MQKSLATETVAATTRSSLLTCAGDNSLCSISAENEMCREWTALGTLQGIHFHFVADLQGKNILVVQQKQPSISLLPTGSLHSRNH